MRTLYQASTVHTLSHPPTGTWLLVDGRHVERVGSGDPPAADRVVDLPGTAILPGFVDAHVHLSGTGEHHRAPEIGGARSAGELLDLLRALVAERTGPILVHGYDESKWERPEPPSVAELDAVSGEPLAVVRVDGHLSLANTKAIQAADVWQEPGAELDERGEPTGRLTLAANARLRRWFQQHLSDRDVEELQLVAAGMAVAHGITCVHEMSMPAERGIRDLQILLRHQGRLPLDVVPYVATTDIAQVMDLGLSGIGGDLPVDGSIGARTALLAEPYEGEGGTGVASFGQDQLAGFFHAGHLAGLQVGVHAIGDGAIGQVVSAWERVYRALDSRERRHFRARRHRVEHFEMAGPDLLERAAALGLAISVQPTFDAEWGGPGAMYEARLGLRRARSMNPFRSMLDRGLELGAGSDSPITTIDPMVGVAAFEDHHDPLQRLSRQEAIRAYTTGSARLARLEDKKGSLAPGMHADFAVWDEDPMEAPLVEGLHPVLTVSLGREVFAS